MEKSCASCWCSWISEDLALHLETGVSWPCMNCDHFHHGVVRFGTVFVGMAKMAFFAVVVCAKSHSQALIFWKQQDFSTKWIELWTTSTWAKQYTSEACRGNIERSSLISKKYLIASDIQQKKSVSRQNYKQLKIGECEGTACANRWPYHHLQ